MPEGTHFSVRGISQHYGDRAEVTMVREGRNVTSSESVKVSLTLGEAAGIKVGSTYRLQFEEVAQDGQD